MLEAFVCSGGRVPECVDEMLADRELKRLPSLPRETGAGRDELASSGAGRATDGDCESPPQSLNPQPLFEVAPPFFMLCTSSSPVVIVGGGGSFIAPGADDSPLLKLFSAMKLRSASTQVSDACFASFASRSSWRTVSNSAFKRLHDSLSSSASVAESPSGTSTIKSACGGDGRPPKSVGYRALLGGGFEPATSGRAMICVLGDVFASGLVSPHDESETDETLLCEFAERPVRGVKEARLLLVGGLVSMSVARLTSMGPMLCRLCSVCRRMSPRLDLKVGVSH